MTYLQLFNYLKQLNNNKYLDQVLFEFVYDKLVFDKNTFIQNKNIYCKNYKKKIKLFQKVIKKDIPWERVLKYTYFYNLKIKLLKNVFSPRQDTELLVYYVLEYLKNNIWNTKTKIIDLGSGSGCISCSLNKNLNSHFEIFAFENNFKAFLNTKINKKKLNCNFIVFKKDYLKLMKKDKLIDFDILVCNPPYIDFEYKLEKNVSNFDPKSALFAKNNGYFYYEEILKFLCKKNNKICAFFEIGFNQKEQLILLLKKYDFLNFEFFKDFNNNDRVLKICHNFN